MEDEKSCFLVILAISVLFILGGIWGTEILYGIVPALIVAPYATLIYLKYDKEKIEKAGVSSQFLTYIVLAIVVSIIVALGSYFIHNELDDTSTTTICIISLITLIISGYVGILITKDSLKKDEQAEILEKEEMIKIKREKDKEQEIRAKYGICGQKITNPKNPANDYLVRVFFQTKNVILNKNDVFSFSDIIRCNIEKREEDGHTLKTIKTNVPDNTSIVGRSLAGGLIAGAPGAIIGGLTAKNKEKVKYEYSSCKIEKYKVHIYTKKSNFPIVTFDTDENFSLAENIKNTIDAIIAMA